MKKTFKIIAFIIVIVFLFTMSASAQDKTIEWDYGYDDSYRETYVYGGELKLGKNKIVPVDEVKWYDFDGFYCVYYEFDVEKSGYYGIEIFNDYTLFAPDISQDIRDGIVYGEKDCMYLDNGSYCVYLEEGDCIFGIEFVILDPDYFDGDYSGELNIEFIGEEIIDIQIDDEYLEDIILGYHIASEYDENDTTEFYVSGKIIFNNGKECEFSNIIEAEYPDDIAPGENKITFDLWDSKKEYTVQIKTVDDYIESIEIGNLEEVAVVTQTFIPDYAYPPDYYIELIINKPDGTKITDNEVYYYYDIDLKGDKQLSIWFDYIQDDDGEWYFIAYAGNKELLREPCKIIPASFENNCFIFIEKAADCILFMRSDFSWYMSDAFGILSGLSITERFESFSDAFAAIRDCCSEIYELIEMFYNYAR